LLTHTFVYSNTSSATVTDGSDLVSDELGVTLSHFFPATESKYCVDGVVL
jgi:hypothetical protein